MHNALTDLSLIYLLSGTGIGFLLGWLVTRLLFQSRYVSKIEIDQSFVSKVVSNNLQEQVDVLHAEVQEKTEQIKDLAVNLATKVQQNEQLAEKLEQQKWEAIEWHQKSKAEFEVLANKLLEEKSKKFTQQNWQKLTELLLPLKDRIKTFEDQIEKRFIEETRDRISLKKELEHLQLLNTQLSQDANNLADALKGKSKIQGDWGELQLQLLLEKAGLSKNLHYQTQSSYRDDNGKQKRPDFIIHLPNDRHLVIDSKVPLRAYESYYNCQNEDERKQFLKGHLGCT